MGWEQWGLGGVVKGGICEYLISFCRSEYGMSSWLTNMCEALWGLKRAYSSTRSTSMTERLFLGWLFDENAG